MSELPVAPARRIPWWPAVLLLVLACLCSPTDERVTGWLTDEAVGPRVVNGLEKFGFWLGVLVVLAILYSFPNGRRICVGFLVPLVIHLPVLHLLKWALGRARPLAEVGAWRFAPFSGDKFHDAFPSGHATMVGVVALTLGVYFPRVRWVFYLWALSVGLERIVSEYHYLSDVVGGFALAWLIVYGCVRVLGPRFYTTGLPPRTPAQSGASAV